MKKLSLLVAILLLAIALLVGCNSQQGTQDPALVTPGDNNEPAPNTGAELTDTLKIAVDVDAIYLDPRMHADSTAYRLDEIIFAGLIKLDTSLTPQPAIAERWENVDDLTWVFYLRDDVTFHDGTPLTAKDVKYTYESELDPELGAKWRALYTPLASVDVIDDYTVQFNLSEPYAPFLTYMDLGIVPENCDEDPDWLNHAVGAGPYKIVSHTKNESIKLAAYEGYFDTQPSIKNIDVFVINEASTRASALESGDVEMIYAPINPRDTIRLRDDSRFNVVEVVSTAYTMLDFCHKSEILSEKAVRVGIAHMIDRNLIADTIYEGVDMPGQSPLIPGSWSYSDDVTMYPYDPDEGVRILNEAGWVDSDGDGILDRDGKKLSIELMTHVEDKTRIQAVEYLQNIWQQYGIDVKVTTMEWSTYFAKVTSLDFDIAMLGVSQVTDPDRGFFNQFHSNGTNNWGGFANPELDKLLEEGRVELDQAKRKEIYKQAAQLVNDEVMYYNVNYQAYVNIHSTRLEGFVAYPTGSLWSLVDCTLLAE